MDGTAFTPSSPADVAAAANALLGSLDEVLWAAKTPDEVVDTVAACESIRAHLAAIEAAALVEVEDRKIAKTAAGVVLHRGLVHPPRRDPPPHRPRRRPPRQAPRGRPVR